MTGPQVPVWPRSRRGTLRRAIRRLTRRWIIFGAAGIAVLWFGGRAAIRLPWRTVTEVSVLGTRFVNPEVVREQANVPLGAPLFGIDVDSVRARVEALPWVHRARITRHVLSGIFEIRVEEYTPVGMFWRNGFFLLGASGVNIPLEETLPPDVPLVTGLPEADSARTVALKRAGKLLNIAAGLAPLWSALSEISLADSSMAVLLLSPRGVPVWLPPDPGRDRLVAVASVIARHPEVLRQARYLDARFVGHIAVGS